MYLRTTPALTTNERHLTPHTSRHITPRSRLEVQVEELFALFGPFWVPLAVPLLKLAQSHFRDRRKRQQS
jgi:hypothetical protein